MSLREKINYLKEIKGLTSLDIINATSIPKGTLDKILTGVTTNPRMETVLLLRNYFNVTIDYLVDDDIDVTDVIYRNPNLIKEEPFIDIDVLSDDKKKALKGYYDRLLDETDF